MVYQRADQAGLSTLPTNYVNGQNNPSYIPPSTAGQARAQRVHYTPYNSVAAVVVTTPNSDVTSPTHNQAQPAETYRADGSKFVV
jgi:hypothetical protein